MPIQKSEQQTDEKAIQPGYFGGDALCGIMADEASWRWQEDKYLSLILDCGLLQIAQTGWKRYLLLDDWLLVVTNVFFADYHAYACGSWDNFDIWRPSDRRLDKVTKYVEGMFQTPSKIIAN